MAQPRKFGIDAKPLRKQLTELQQELRNQKTTFPADADALDQAIKRLKLIDDLIGEFCVPGDEIPFKKK